MKNITNQMARSMLIYDMPHRRSFRINAVDCGMTKTASCDSRIQVDAAGWVPHVTHVAVFTFHFFILYG